LGSEKVSKLHKTIFQMAPFCLIFELGHKKKEAVTFPALITDTVDKPVTCSGRSIFSADNEKKSCKHPQVRHGNPCDGVALCKKNVKKNSNQTIPALPPACQNPNGPCCVPNNKELLLSLWHMSILLQERQPKRPDSTGRPTMELNYE
jgi:hypothetical protein